MPKLLNTWVYTTRLPHLNQVWQSVMRGTDGDRTRDLSRVRRTLIPAELRFHTCISLAPHHSSVNVKLHVLKMIELQFKHYEGHGTHGDSQAEDKRERSACVNSQSSLTAPTGVARKLRAPIWSLSASAHRSVEAGSLHV